MFKAHRPLCHSTLGLRVIKKKKKKKGGTGSEEEEAVQEGGGEDEKYIRSPPVLDHIPLHSPLYGGV